jgi:hypothetical protein
MTLLLSVLLFVADCALLVYAGRMVWKREQRIKHLLSLSLLLRTRMNSYEYRIDRMSDICRTLACDTGIPFLASRRIGSAGKDDWTWRERND